MESTKFRCSSLLFFFIVAFISAGYSDAAADDKQCLYTIKVRTSAVKNAGTDSNINLILGDANGKTFTIQNLANWGVNGPSYDYFEMGSLDMFSGRAPCMSVCRIIVASDDSGNKSGWKLDNIEITTTGAGSQISHPAIFQFNQWLAKDEPPHSLSALQDMCNEEVLRAGGARRSALE